MQGMQGKTVNAEEEAEVGDRVGSYFETDEGIQVDLAEDAKTWLIRDEVFVEVEAGEEMMVEKPIETPVEETGEETPEA